MMLQSVKLEVEKSGIPRGDFAHASRRYREGKGGFFTINPSFFFQ
jgi:hypothetical protein